MMFLLRQLRAQLHNHFYYHFDNMDLEQRLSIQNILATIDAYLKESEDF